MINGNPNDFLDHVYSGQDTVFLFNEKKYWIQGYNNPNNSGWHIEIFECTSTGSNIEWIWIYDAPTIEECYSAFLAAPIFNGKTFWESEGNIEWIDC